jgi:hypothetical protein
LPQAPLLDIGNLSATCPVAVLVNFKCCLEGTGARAVRLAKYAEQASSRYRVTVAVALR